MKNHTDLDSFITALGIMGIIVELLAYSQPLGIITGVATLIYLYLIAKQNEHNENNK